ncbi:DUF938 domain-containing protein [Profundibacterium mesophilum]|nr:DUF938 domain-containing protein [Profundibacterium mesophilum]
MSDAPSSAHVVRYTEADAAGRLHSEICLRNGPPLIAALAPWLSGASGAALEIGSGTGQHAAALSLAFPALALHASDPDETHRRSAGAWAQTLRVPPRPVFELDAARTWSDRPDISALGPLAAILAINVIHIAPAAVLAGIVRGAAARLGPSGLLIFYGPFRQEGIPLGPGNAAFDARLRESDPAWGLRAVGEIDALAAEGRLARGALIEMPAQNHLLIYRKAR